jgi:hypothetical protein
MGAVDRRAGKVGSFEEAFFKTSLFQLGVFETDSRQITKKKYTAGQISLFEFTRGEREFFGGQIIRSLAFFKNTILHDGAGEITVSEFDSQKVQVA